MTLAGAYRPRHPENTAFYQCLQDYWPEFRESYPYFYEKEQGPLRPVVEKTVERFLECGIFRHGFARIRCADCHHEYLLAFSCKTRYFCPSCQAKRVAAFVEWVTQQILEPIEHRHKLLWFFEDDRLELYNLAANIREARNISPSKTPLAPEICTTA